MSVKGKTTLDRLPPLDVNGDEPHQSNTHVFSYRLQACSGDCRKPLGVISGTGKTCSAGHPSTLQNSGSRARKPFSHAASVRVECCSGVRGFRGKKPSIPRLPRHVWTWRAKWRSRGSPDRSARKVHGTTE